jgi:hypothetical protein
MQKQINLCYTGICISNQDYGAKKNKPFFISLNTYIIVMGHAVAQLVEALRYKPERSGFDSQWCHWNFSLT